MALMCIPEARSAPLSTGCDAVVAVQIIWAPRAASEAELAGSTGTPIRRGISSAKRLRRSALRPYTRAEESLRTAAIASSCVLACPPVPMIAATEASRQARYFVGTPETGPGGGCPIERAYHVAT